MSRRSYKINNDWDVLISESLQNLDAEGPSTELPVGSDFQPLKPLETTFFSPIYDHDQLPEHRMDGERQDRRLQGDLRRRLHQPDTSPSRWTTRTTPALYTANTTSAPAAAAGLLGARPRPLLLAGDQLARPGPNNTHLSNEVRVSTPDTWRLRGLVGAYFESFRIEDNMNFNYRTVPSCGEQNNLAVARRLAERPASATSTTAPGFEGERCQACEATPRASERT